MHGVYHSDHMLKNFHRVRLNGLRYIFCFIYFASILPGSHLWLISPFPHQAYIDHLVTDKPQWHEAHLKVSARAFFSLAEMPTG